MQDESNKPILAGAPQISYAESELEKFVLEFEPGYVLLFSDLLELARRYRAKLSPERIENLRSELDVFVRLHQGKSNEDLRASWFKAGANECPRDEDMLEMLNDFQNIFS